MAYKLSEVTELRIIQKAVIFLFAVSVVIFGVSKVSEIFGGESSKPVIKSTSDSITVSCDYTEKEILAGLTAEDRQDGDLTDEIIVGNLSRFIEKGKTKATYVVFDSSNQPATYTREVVFSDYVSPQFRLGKPLVLKTNSSANEKDLVSATDVFDGDITGRVKITESNINYNVTGDYVVKAEVSNSFGDTVKASLPVHVVTEPETRVEISLKENVVYLEKGEKFNALSYIDRVTSFFGQPMDKASVGIESLVNTSKPGCYEVKFTATDETGNRGVTYMIVFVTEKGEI